MNIRLIKIIMNLLSALLSIFIVGICVWIVIYLMIYDTGESFRSTFINECITLDKRDIKTCEYLWGNK